MVREIMIEFAKMTGLLPETSLPKRYLWTDAYAVCNFLGLYRKTNDEQYRRFALLMVDQVHATLGRHRRDDPRTGWISGLDEEEGRSHPTKGGLRIGKEMKERRPEEPFDELLEWTGRAVLSLPDTMDARPPLREQGYRGSDLSQVGDRARKNGPCKVHLRPAGWGEKRLYWKMSIDLSYPLVSSMGHHDPLNGLITYSELQPAAGNYSERSPLPHLSSEIADMAVICEKKTGALTTPLASAVS